jgi:YHS domain-containing protein
MKQFSALLLILTLCLTSNAQAEKRQKGYNLTGSHLAIRGYDPVAYFTESKAVKGRGEWSLVHEGITYQFASARNRESFRAAPATYEPQYGGWCAYAMGASGEKVDVDPQTFKILNGKLYLFYNRFFNNTLKSWNKDEAALARKADAAWSKLYH